MSAGFFGQTNKLSENAKNAFHDLKALGYDVDALGRRNMNDEEVLELRDKAFRYRGMEIPGNKGMSDLVNLFELGVDLSLKSPPDEARMMAKHILYLAEKQLAEM
ncbi:MAG TPA: hypothetical protein VJ742_07325 [Nitrososphaera sp.]|nr:hypothetical protein [Nitrososphaera sp.]